MINKIKLIIDYKLSVLLLVFLSLSACDFSKPSLIKSENPLLGKLYQTSSQKFIDQEQFASLLQNTNILLIGETHDNPEHHNKQVEILMHYLAHGQTGLVALEMVTDTQMEKILKDKPNDATSLISVLNQEGDGWEYDKYYKGVFEAIYKAGYMITAANFNRKTMSAIVMEGDTGIPSEIKSIVEHVPLNEENNASLQKEIESSHCGMALGKHAVGMITGQRVRDAYMAKSVVDAKSKTDKVVLLAGSGHVRSDRGVPIYIKYLAPTLNVVSIGLAEVVEGHDDPQDYAKRWGATSLPFDLVWFTSAVDRPDPCEELKKHMKNMPHSRRNKTSESDK